MFQFIQRVLCSVVVAIGYTASVASAIPVTIFKDDFQSDTAVLSDSATDADPVIGVGDTGGNWAIIESPALSVQVENDDVPAQNGQNGSLVAGANNYVRVYRGGGNSTRGAPFARGWTVADTIDRLVQLSMNVYQPTASSMSVFFGTTNPGGISVNSGVNAFTNASTVTAALNTALDDNQWLPVQIIANLSATTIQNGLNPQTYTVTINNGTPTTNSFLFTGTGSNQVTAILVGLSDVNETFNYIDDVQVQILNPPVVAVAGDYNGNGTVDAADYVVWRKNQGGAGGSASVGDSEPDGDVDDADYTFWRERFGNTSSGSGSGLSSSAVPEPAAALLLAVGAGILLGSGRRKAEMRGR